MSALTSSAPLMHTESASRPPVPSMGILRFITCGSVDDGKSTLIGRMLIEAGAVYEDQLASLKNDSRKHGTTDSEMDAALLVDGLEEERQQGITIDVAYRYFATPRRKFIIADTPGHEQFTRNMATGASTADLAILLVDASKGILTQTKRHAFLVSLLGIKHAIVAVNKMDLVDYSQSVFESIQRDFSTFAERLELPNLRFVPLSALKGDNIAKPSDNMPWYEGSSLLGLLETVEITLQEHGESFRFPVQWVNRPDSSFRGFCGTVASGEVQIGDAITVLPSGKRSRVKQIVHADGCRESASFGRSTTLVLEDEIDISRGDMLVPPDRLPQVAQTAEAMLVWMSEKPLVPGKQYWFKHTTKRLTAEVEAVVYETDVNTLENKLASSLRLNQIGLCRIRTSAPICFDDYRHNRLTGSFILVDKISCETVAAGMLRHPDQDSARPDYWKPEHGNVRIEAYQSLISSDQRSAAYHQQPLTILITGLCGAGKTSLAKHLEKQLFDAGKISLVLDGGDWQGGLNRDLGFTSDDRSENLRRAAEIARLVNRAGQICIAAFVAPQQEVRSRVRDLIGPQNFFHVHLATEIDTCRGRDRSGQYRLAERGEINHFPGVSAKYEYPEDADLILDSIHSTPAQLAEQVMQALHQRNALGSDPVFRS